VCWKVCVPSFSLKKVCVENVWFLEIQCFGGVIGSNTQAMYLLCNVQKENCCILPPVTFISKNVLFKFIEYIMYLVYILTKYIKYWMNLKCFFAYKCDQREYFECFFKLSKWESNAVITQLTFACVSNNFRVVYWSLEIYRLKVDPVVMSSAWPHRL
jgi:hypothetical protein